MQKVSKFSKKYQKTNRIKQKYALEFFYTGKRHLKYDIAIVLLKHHMTFKPLAGGSGGAFALPGVQVVAEVIAQR